MKGKLGSCLFALAFAIPFGGVGAGATYGIVTTLQDTLRAEDWVVVQAHVDAAELKTSRGSKGGVTYQATGTYHYTFGGRKYVSSRLGFDALGGSDNVGDWQESMAAFLEEAKQSGKTIPVYVNPDNPSEAVVDRGIRWAMLLFMGLFAVLFGGVGLGALVAIGFILRGKPVVSAAPAARVRPAGSAAASDAWKSAGFLWFFTIVWNLISFPIALIAVPDIIRKEEWVGLLVLLFPAIGLLLAWSAIATTLGLLRRGKATIALQPETPQAGSSFNGSVSFARGVQPGEAFKVRLVCNRTVKTSNSQSTAPGWSREVAATAQAGAQGARVAFRFEIPADVPQAEPSTGERTVSHAWRIEVAPARASGMTSYGFDIEVRPAPAHAFPRGPELGGLDEFPDTAFAAAAPSGPAPAMQDSALAQLLGPEYARTLSAEQRARFAAMPPEAREAAAKITRNLPKIKKIIIGVVVAFFLLQVLGAIIVAILASTSSS